MIHKFILGRCVQCNLAQEELESAGWDCQGHPVAASEVTPLDITERTADYDAGSADNADMSPSHNPTGGDSFSYQTTDGADLASSADTSHNFQEHGESPRLRKIKQLRDDYLQYLVYTVKILETGVPASVIAERIHDYLVSFRFVWIECDGRSEFWQAPSPRHKEDATVCAVFIEQNGSNVKVSFGTLSLVHQVLKANAERPGSSISDAAAGAFLLGPGVGLAAGLASSAVGAGVSIVNKVFEKTFWSKIEAIVQELNSKFSKPAAPIAADTYLDRLEKLIRIRDAGAIEPEEFDRLKAEILSSSASSLPSHPTVVEQSVSDGQNKSLDIKLVGSKTNKRKRARGNSQNSGPAGWVLIIISLIVWIIPVIGWIASPILFFMGVGQLISEAFPQRSKRGKQRNSANLKSCSPPCEEKAMSPDEKEKGSSHEDKSETNPKWIAPTVILIFLVAVILAIGLPEIWKVQAENEAAHRELEQTIRQKIRENPGAEPDMPDPELFAKEGYTFHHNADGTIDLWRNGRPIPDK